MTNAEKAKSLVKDLNEMLTKDLSDPIIWAFIADHAKSLKKVANRAKQETSNV